MNKTYGVDCQLAHDYFWWLNHLEPDLMYDRPNENREKVSDQTSVTPEAPVAQPPFTLPADAPAEFVKTKPKGTTPADTMETALYEVCPLCDTVLRLYKVKDGDRLIFRCSNCFVKLKNSQIGWVVDDT